MAQPIAAAKSERLSARRTAVSSVEATTRWLVDPVRREGKFITLLARLNISKDAFQDFYILPNVDHRKRFSIGRKDIWLNRGERLVELPRLCEIVNSLDFRGASRYMKHLIPTFGNLPTRLTSGWRVGPGWVDTNLIHGHFSAAADNPPQWPDPLLLPVSALPAMRKCSGRGRRSSQRSLSSLPTLSSGLRIRHLG